MIATVPLVAWIASSFVLHGGGLTLPNGLRGVNELERPGASGRLESGDWTSPDDILASLADIGLALVLKAALAIGAVTGVVSLLVAVLVGDLGASLAVTINAMRLARAKP